MENEIDKLRYVVIPAKDTRGGQDIRVEVAPVTNSWLLGKERKWDEVDAVLEGRLQAIQRSFTEIPGEPDQMARSYGVEKPIGDNLARLFAYAELLDEYRVAQQSHLGLAGEERKKYDEEREQIRAQRKSKAIAEGKFRQLIEAASTKYDSQIREHSEAAREAQLVGDIVLRKAVLDFFSWANNSTELKQPLAVQQLPRLLAEAETTFGHSQASDAFRERKPVDYLVDSLGGYLSRTKDEGLFIQYSYRKSDDLVATREDCLVLGAALEMALDPATPAQSKLAESYLDFLKNRAARVALKEPYPYLSLVYDLMATATVSDSQKVMEGVSGVVDQRFMSLTQSQAIKKEGIELIRSGNQIGLESYRELIALKAATGSVSFLDKPLPPEPVLRYMRSNEFRLIFGLMFYDYYAGYYSDILLLKRSKFLDAVGSQIRFEKGKTALEVEEAAGELLREDLSVALRYPMPGVVGTAGIEGDLFANIMTLSRVMWSAHPSSEPQRKYMLETYERVHKGDKGLTNEEKLRAIRVLQTEKTRVSSEEAHYPYVNDLRFYLAAFFTEYGLPEEQIEKENRHLWDEVLDKSTWFVSPRGDRFSVRGDPELAQYAIESITFRVDRQRPREHRVTVQVAGLDAPFDFWLNTKRELMDSQREPLLIDLALRDHFANLVLKRLYTITSGLLSEDTEHVPGERERGHIFEYRRAHYRVLTSTDRKRITMESPGVQTHADLIKKDYGIDIFAEMKRRRALGTIRPDQYLTFVQESTPSVRGRLVLPNELKYDPLLVQIPN